MDLMPDLVFSILRFSAPLILAAMAGLFSERSGVIQIALEGFILIGAFTAASAAYFTKSGWLGVSAAMAVGALCGVFFSWVTVKLRSDQIVAGTAMNMLAWGGLPTLSKILFDSTANTPALEFSERLNDHVPIVLALISVGLTIFLIYRTSFGLWVQFSGEKPEALKAVGISPSKVRFVSLMIAGALAALSGAMLSTALSSAYTRNMAAGRGFMALAALILGKWRPIPTLLGCLLFGASEVLQLKLQGVSIEGLGTVPVSLIQIVPYVLTLVLLAGFMRESRAPAALGK